MRTSTAEPFLDLTEEEKINDPTIDDYDEYDPDNRRCSWCGGDGFQFGYELDDPLWYDDDRAYRCFSCGGSGLAKDMTIW